ncbi:unnamed protein product [Boreogadus saida]
MSRKKLAWANKEVETFVCILGEEDVVYDVYVDAAAIDIRPTTKGTVGSGNATSELSWANRSLPTAPLRSDPFRTLQWKCGISYLCLYRAGSVFGGLCRKSIRYFARPKTSARVGGGSPAETYSFFSAKMRKGESKQRTIDLFSGPFFFCSTDSRLLGPLSVD